MRGQPHSTRFARTQNGYFKETKMADTNVLLAGNPNTLNWHRSLRKCSPCVYALDTSSMAVFMLLKNI